MRGLVQTIVFIVIPFALSYALLKSVSLLFGMAAATWLAAGVFVVALVVLCAS